MVTVFGHGMVLVHDGQSGQAQVTVHMVLNRADFDQVPGEERRVGKNFIEVEVATGEPPAVDDKVTG